MDYYLTREEYRILVEKAPIMIWRSDLTMACDYFNEVWLAFTGRTMAQEVGNYWKQIESYVTRHSDATFSHGICRECLSKALVD